MTVALENNPFTFSIQTARVNVNALHGWEWFFRDGEPNRVYRSRSSQGGYENANGDWISSKVTVEWWDGDDLPIPFIRDVSDDSPRPAAYVIDGTEIVNVIIIVPTEDPVPHDKIDSARTQLKSIGEP